MTAGCSNGVSLVVLHLVLFVAVAAFADTATESVKWTVGGWDERDAPSGKLLTDNAGWWGRCVFTGVTYSYEKGFGPTAPCDVLKGDGGAFGRRLLDGQVGGSWHVPIGRNGKIVVAFDFKRPCVFSEVDLLGTRLTEAGGLVETSADGANWTPAVSFTTTAARTRLPLDHPAEGRYLRLSLKAIKGATYLDEVLVWGDGEVSEVCPEAIAAIPSGDALQFTCRRDGGIEIWPIVLPMLEKCKVKCGKAGGHGAVMSVADTNAVPILLARNETEVRYFAIANASSNAAMVALTPPDFGDSAISAELLIGGVVRAERPKVKLTEKQIIDLLVTDIAAAEGGGDTNRLEVLPFFTPSQVPSANFARRYLANAAHVVGFPDAVPLAPGEGCVVMLRIKTDGASPGGRAGVMRVADATCGVAVRIVDVTLPTPSIWIHAYAPFTRQFPFESERRMQTDVARLAALGVSSCYGWPTPHSKQMRLKALAPHTIFATQGECPQKLYGDIYHGKWDHFDPTDRAILAKGAHSVVSKARELGLKPDDYCAFLPDEPGRKNAALVGEMARIWKEAEPSLMVYMNPCFWEPGFPPETAILDCLKPYYNELIDISCPIRNLVRPTNALTKELWTAKRRVNAQYIHPPARAGRSIAWSSFENGMNGFAYYCYYAPRGNPWDIRTWGSLDYRYQMVFPLENDVAVTPIYETMREAWEDYRLLTALRNAGKEAILGELLSEFESATNYADIENVPNRASFSELRERALAAFDGQAGK